MPTFMEIKIMKSHISKVKVDRQNNNKSLALEQLYLCSYNSLSRLLHPPLEKITAQWHKNENEPQKKQKNWLQVGSKQSSQ